MDKQELIKLLEINNQTIKHHHDALWKEETHYTWLLYILVAGVIFIFINIELGWVLKTIIITGLGMIGFIVCLAAYKVVRREGQFMHIAIQTRNRLNYAIGLNQSVIVEPDFNGMLVPNQDVEIKRWDETESDANKPLKILLKKGILKPHSLGIRDWFQVTLLLPILVFAIMLVLSITEIFIA